MFRLPIKHRVRQRLPRIIDKKYKGYIAALPCVILNSRPVEVAHLRSGSPLYKKRPTGMAEKPSDKWTLPLSAEMHRLSNDAQHNHNELEWWASHHINPFELCIDLQKVYPDLTRARDIIQFHRAKAMVEYDG